MMHTHEEPVLEHIEDYNAPGGVQKRLTVWIVILSGLLVGALYALAQAHGSVSDALPVKTNIIKN